VGLKLSEHSNSKINIMHLQKEF